MQSCLDGLDQILAIPARYLNTEPRAALVEGLDSLIEVLGLSFAGGWINPSESVETRLEAIRGTDQQDLIITAGVVETWNFFVADIAYRAHPLRRWIQNREISVVSVPIGVGGKLGTILAASEKSTFPRPLETSILKAAANQIVISLQQRMLLRLNARQTAATLPTARRTQVSEASEKEISPDRAAHDLRIILDAIPGMVGTVTPDMRYEFVNQQFLDFFGLTLEELQNWKANGNVHPDDLDAAVAATALVMSTGQPYDVEIRRKRYDGVYRWLRMQGRPLHDDAGNIIRWYMLLTDIEDSKRAEALLRESERDFRLIIDTIPAMVCTLKPDWEVEFVNQNVFDYFQQSLGELKDWGDNVHPDDLEMVVDRIKEALATQKPYHVEHRCRRYDGAYRWFDVHSTPALDEHGTILRWYVLLTDIEDRKRAEEAFSRARFELAKVSRMTTMGVLTASIAHEVNQPLSGIVTNAETCELLLRSDPPDIAGALETVRRTLRDGNRASEVVTHLRSLFSQKRVTLGYLDLAEAAHEVIGLIVAELQAKRVLLNLDLDNRLHTVNGDRVQLQQVILNLIRNAADAMSDIDGGGHVILVRAYMEKGNACFSVKDSGCGFDEAISERLFEPFFSTKDEGMGVGLAVSRSIIEAHEGQMWASRNDMGGATFGFWLPPALPAPGNKRKTI